MEQFKPIQCNHCKESFTPKIKIQKMCGKCSAEYIDFLCKKLHKINDVARESRNKFAKQSTQGIE